jgi:hypothetical protein
VDGSNTSDGSPSSSPFSSPFTSCNINGQTCYRFPSITRWALILWAGSLPLWWCIVPLLSNLSIISVHCVYGCCPLLPATFAFFPAPSTPNSGIIASLLQSRADPAQAINLPRIPRFLSQGNIRRPTAETFLFKAARTGVDSHRHGTSRIQFRNAEFASNSIFAPRYGLFHTYSPANYENMA